MTTPLPTDANRLALGIMISRGIDYDAAIITLRGLSLRLACDDGICHSVALQASLITALNCGQRAFLGGVQIEIPEDVPLLLPWPKHSTLNEVIAELQGIPTSAPRDASQTIHFGFRPANPPPHAVTVHATGWRGGIEPSNSISGFDSKGEVDFALGGVFAAGLAVHRGFLRAAGISPFACDEPVGVSLWEPTADWLAAKVGPPLRALPAGLWMLGLGHLGQAYLWTLGLLPFAEPAECEVMLQDFDPVEKANIGAGLLCEEGHVGTYKTRVCSKWIEARGFRSRFCERPFDKTIRRLPNEPAIALCGFDRAEPRRLLEGAGFSHVLECGLGGSLNDFDLIHVHNFPGRRTAKEIWKDPTKVAAPNDDLVRSLAGPDETCGALAIETAGKSASTSFIGVMASSMIFGELLRAFHKGPRFDEVFFTPRNMIDSDFVRSPEPYSSSQIAKAGFATISASANLSSSLPIDLDLVS